MTLVLPAIRPFLLALATAVGADSSKPADEILRLVPAEAAACLVVEDLAGHYRRFVGSEVYARISQFAWVQNWRASADYAKLAAVRTVVPALFGVDIEAVSEQILGRCVVLALLPGATPTDPGVGILFCSATDAQLLTRLIGTFTGSSDRDGDNRRSHRGVEYSVRSRPGEKSQFVFQIGSVGVMTDHEASARRVIDASLDGGGFGALPTVAAMRQAIGPGTVMQLVALPRRFDGYLERWAATSQATETRIAGWATECWKRVQWMALSLRITDRVELGWHGMTERNGAAKRDPGLERSSAFWNRVPDRSLVAVYMDCDFEALAGSLRRILADESHNDLRNVCDLFSQLIAGYDVWRDVLPRLGPLAGLVVSELADAPGLTLLLAIQFRDAAPAGEQSVPLSWALESAIRPLLVVIGAEHNKSRGDAVRTALRIKEGVRAHVLEGSRHFPNWLQPGFCIHGGFVMFASSPAAMRGWLLRSRVGSEGTPALGFVEKWMPAEFVPFAYINVTRIVATIRRHEKWLFGQMRTAPADGAAAKFSALLELAGLLDRIVVGRRIDAAGNLHWTLTLFGTGRGASQRESK